MFIIDNEPAFIHYNIYLKRVTIAFFLPFIYAYWPNVLLGAQMNFQHSFSLFMRAYTNACSPGSWNCLIEIWLSWHRADIIQFLIGCVNRLNALLLYVYVWERLIKPFLSVLLFYSHGIHYVLYIQQLILW